VSKLFVAKSKDLQDWGHGVGVTKFLFKVGVFDGSGEDATARLNEDKAGGREDWKLLAQQDSDQDEATALAQLALREQQLDPDFYPTIRGEPGIFKVKVSNVEDDMMLRAALANENEQLKTLKAKDKDIAAYLLRRAAQTKEL